MPPTISKNSIIIATAILVSVLLAIPVIQGVAKTTGTKTPVVITDR